MSEPRITVLSGGVGAARFLEGLVRVFPPEEVTAVVNTGDDEQFHGLHVSPDLDIITYTLAGLVDPGKGWGLAGDTFNCLSMLGALGHPTWFNLGDKDMGVHVHRTLRLRQGQTLSQTSEEIRSALGVGVRILPMSDDRVRTVIAAEGETLTFQEYFVKGGASQRVTGIEFEGAGDARPAPGVIEAIESSHAVVVAPSNPFVSIGTILAVPGIREALRGVKRGSGSSVVAVSPIIGGRAVKGPAADMLSSMGHERTAAAVAALYRDFLDVMVLDERDGQMAEAVEKLGIEAEVTDTVMDSMEKKMSLASFVLRCTGIW